MASVSPWAEAWRRFKRHRLAYWSLWLLSFLVLAVLLGPLFYKTGINEVDFAASLSGPSAKHPFGTDDLGRDILARMLYGGRISLAVGFSAMLMAITVGVIIGAIAGMARGWVDAALMWLTDLFLSLPQLPLLLLLIFLFREPLKQVFAYTLFVLAAYMLFKGFQG
jgi:peptide/nickel transport system permease protein